MLRQAHLKTKEKYKNKKNLKGRHIPDLGRHTLCTCRPIPVRGQPTLLIKLTKTSNQSIISFLMEIGMFSPLTIQDGISLGTKCIVVTNGSILISIIHLFLHINSNTCQVFHSGTNQLRGIMFRKLKNKKLNILFQKILWRKIHKFGLERICYLFSLRMLVPISCGYQKLFLSNLLCAGKPCIQFQQHLDSW